MSLRHFPPSLLSPGSSAAPAARPAWRPNGPPAGEPASAADLAETVRVLTTPIPEYPELEEIRLGMIGQLTKVAEALADYISRELPPVDALHLTKQACQVNGSFEGDLSSEAITVAVETGDARC